MFAPSAVSVFSQENSDTLLKKPGATNTTSRKPFNDQPVNSTPARELKKKLELDAGSAPTLTTDEDDLFFYDTYSFKDIEDDYPDISLTPKEILGMLRSYCGYYLRQPTAKAPKDLHMFLEMPDKDFVHTPGNCDPELLLEDVIDVSLPTIEL